MKTSILSFIVLVFLIFTSCQPDRRNFCTVSITVPSGDYDSLSYYVSKDGLTAYSSWSFNQENFDSTGILNLIIETDDISWLFLTFFRKTYSNHNRFLNRAFLLAQPGQNYSVIYDSLYPLLFRIEGDNAKGQNLFNKFSHKVSNNGTDWLNNDAEEMSSFLLHLQDSIINSMKPFDVLRKQNDIDKSFHNAVLNQVKYAHVGGLIASKNIRRSAYQYPEYADMYPEIHPLEMSDREWNQLLEVIFTRYPVTKEDAGLMANLGNYIDTYLKYKTRKQNINYNSYKGELQLVEQSSVYLEEDLQEMYFAYQFNSSSMRTGPDSLATFLFPAFKKRYPDSKFMPGVIRSITGLTGFYANLYPGLYDSDEPGEIKSKYAQEFIFSDEFHFIEENDSFNTFREFLDQFKGRNVLIDNWASWCGSCMYEFRMSDTLNSFLQENDIMKLYVSTDEDKARWLNVINNYDLKGYHYRITNPEIRKDHYLQVHFLPTYMIMDSTGKIVVQNAEKPHTKEKLINQIRESLSLD